MSQEGLITCSARPDHDPDDARQLWPRQHEDGSQGIGRHTLDWLCEMCKILQDAEIYDDLTSVRRSYLGDTRAKCQMASDEGS